MVPRSEAAALAGPGLLALAAAWWSSGRQPARAPARVSPPPPWPPPWPPPPLPSPPPPTPPPTGCSGTWFRVRSGDSLSLIALEACGSANRWPQLCSASHLANCNNLQVGQLICLPAGCSPPGPPSPPPPPPPPCYPIEGLTC